MDSAKSNAEITGRFKVSMSTRLTAFFGYIIPTFGGAISALYLIGMLRALRQSETAGFSAVMAGLTEVTIPVLIALYLGTFLGLAVIITIIVRMVVQTRKSSPSSWFLLLNGLLCLVPAILFLEAESMIIEVLLNPGKSSGIAGAASTINLYSMLSIAAAGAVFLIFMVLSLLPFSSRSKPKWSPLIAAVLIEILIIGLTIFFQLRLKWLYQSTTL